MDPNKAISAFGSKALYYFLYRLYILNTMSMPMMIDRISIDLVE